MATASELDLKSTILGAWTTNNRVTEYLVERIPPEIWSAPAPAGKHRSVRSIAAHLHNSRRMWIGTLGREHGIAVPGRVDERTVTRKGLIAALKRSSRGMVSLLTLGVEHGGRIPPTAAYVWRNLPLDVGHVLTYFVAHEGHHRGQIVMLARQMGRRLPVEVTGGLWQWTRRSAEAR
jgi:uncharacterized damage-inducible protein DinB